MCCYVRSNGSQDDSDQLVPGHHNDIEEKLDFLHILHLLKWWTREDVTMILKATFLYLSTCKI